MYMLFYLECFIRRFQIHTDRDVECFILICQSIIVCILNISSCILIPKFYIHMISNKFRIKILCKEIFTLQIHNRTFLSFLIYNHNRRHSGLLCHKSIVSAEVRSDMYNSCTIFCRHVISRNDTESAISQWRYEWKKLLVFHTNQVWAEITSYNLPRYHLISFFIRTEFCITTCLIKVSRQTLFCKYHSFWFSSVPIVCLYCHILNFRSNTKSRVSSKCPWSCCPCNEVSLSPLCHLRTWILYFELCRNSSIFYIPVTSRLIQLVRAESGSGSRTIRLNGIALI